MRFRLNYFENGFCKIEDMFTGTEKSVKATFESIVRAIKETYKNDVYMLDDDAKETYANEMLAKNNILDNVDSFLDESKKIVLSARMLMAFKKMNREQVQMKFLGKACEK